MQSLALVGEREDFSVGLHHLVRFTCVVLQLGLEIVGVDLPGDVLKCRVKFFIDVVCLRDLRTDFLD